MNFPPHSPTTLPPRTINCPRSFLTREHIDGDFATISFNDYNQVTRNQCYFDQAVAVEKL